MIEFGHEGSLGTRRPQDGAAHCWPVVRKSLLALSLAIACQSALAQVMYRMTHVGTTGCGLAVHGFNGADQATGEKCTAHPGTAHAFLWKHDGTPILDLGPPEANSISFGNAINESGLVTGFAYDSTGEFSFLSSGDGTPMKRIHDGLGGSEVYANAINDLGQLTGSAKTAGNTADHAFLWKNDGSPMLDLGTLGGNESGGAAINGSGQVAGGSEIANTDTFHAFIWKNDGTPIHDLGTLGGASSEAVAINASGQIAGSSFLPGANKNLHAFFWGNDGTPMQDLGTLGGPNSNAVALNDAGQVAGNSYIGQLNTQHAFVWLNNGTRMKDLGSLGGNSSLASELNASGQVTGSAYLDNVRPRAFLWRNDGTTMQDLNKLIDPRDPLKPYVTLTGGLFINDRGDIMARGSDSRTGLNDNYLLHGTVLTLAPRSLAFGNQPINTSSAAKSVTVTNTSSKVVPFTGTALTGPASGQYVVTDNCGASLAGHATCIIQVTFRPIIKGAKYGFLKVNGGEGGLLLVHLTGTGI
jgi:probable HAF family extracellular repeat protein